MLQTCKKVLLDACHTILIGRLVEFVVKGLFPQDFNEYVFFLFDTDDSGSVSIQELLGGFQKLST